MGITEVLTVIFVICKLLGIISWSWWIVFSPEIVAVLIYVVLIIWQIRLHNQINKEARKLFDDWK